MDSLEVSHRAVHKLIYLTKEKIMLKIRNSVSLVLLVLMLMTTYQFVSARTEDTSNPSIAPAIVNSGPGGLTYKLAVPGPPFPSPPVKCVFIPDVVGSIVACPNPSQIPAIVNNDPGGFTNQVEVDSRSIPSAPVKCIDMPGVVGSVAACPNPSQIPAPEWWIKAYSAPNH